MLNTCLKETSSINDWMTVYTSSCVIRTSYITLNGFISIVCDTAKFNGADQIQNEIGIGCDAKMPSPHVQTKIHTIWYVNQKQKLNQANCIDINNNPTGDNIYCNQF